MCGTITLVEHQDQERRQRHRKGNHHRPQLVLILGQQAGRMGELEEHEGELAGLAEKDRQQQPIGDMHAEEGGKHIEHADLDAEDQHHQRGDAQGLGHHHRKGDPHADRDEEQAEQQAFERLQIAVEFVAIFAVGQEHAGEEGTEAGLMPRLAVASAAPMTSARPRAVKASGTLVIATQRIT